ncbi:MAG: hypothetical protein Q8Q85_01590, partial [Gemmatimonadales bacterium]|nr:hypothetical protein [Gemmatimonadales bacterium]
LYQRQALPELLVSREQAIEAMGVLLGATAAIELILDRLAISDLAHHANHEEGVAFNEAIEETDAALVRLASQTAESFEHTQEPAAAQARASS